MPEPKEKEPLLAELEIVGRVPLTQLDSAPGVRRSRSWYLCCPNIGDEEISRESSWRYSSLRPVTAPPAPGRNGFTMVATHSGPADDVTTLRSERDALARALSAERARAAAAARAHDARLAELHGVIAELVRRRAADKGARAIPEEEVSDECESTTQPAGELDNADVSRTDQNDNSSLISPAELPTPQESKVEPLPEDTDTSLTDHVRTEQDAPEVSPPLDSEPSSLGLSGRDSEICVSTARRCQSSRAGHGSCERQRTATDLLPPSPGRCESREAKLASRVRLKRTEDMGSRDDVTLDEAWCVEAAERLALDVCAQAGLREALVSAHNDEAGAALWRARCARLAADCRVLDCALARALDTAQRLSRACAMQESSSVALCGALKAADRALEAYDVILALAETRPAPPPHDRSERAAAESVARRLLARLEAAPSWGEPLLSPGPWHNHNQSTETEEASPPWSEECEARLREHAARLKRDTAALRALRPPPALYSPHDADSDGTPVDSVSVAEMEAAVMMQEVLVARETRAAERAAAAGRAARRDHESESARRRRHRERHWLDAPASETDL